MCSCKKQQKTYVECNNLEVKLRVYSAPLKQCIPKIKKNEWQLDISQNFACFTDTSPSSIQNSIQFLGSGINKNYHTVYRTFTAFTLKVTSKWRQYLQIQTSEGAIPRRRLVESLFVQYFCSRKGNLNLGRRPSAVWPSFVQSNTLKSFIYHTFFTYSIHNCPPFAHITP